MGFRADKRGSGGCAASAGERGEGSDQAEHVSAEGHGRAGVRRLGTAGAQDDPPEAGAWVAVDWGREAVIFCCCLTSLTSFLPGGRWVGVRQELNT